MDVMDRRTFLAEVLVISLLGKISLPTTSELQKISDSKYLATVLKVDSPNSNKRIYPRKVVEKAIKEYLDNNPMLGGLGQLGMTTDAKIHFDKASHFVRNLYFEGDYLKAEIEVLKKLPDGKVLQSMLDHNVGVSFRTSGVGQVRVIEGDIFVIQEDFKLVQICALPILDAAKL
jgi:hypothetical protein